MTALEKTPTNSAYDIPAGIAPDAVWQIQDAKNQLSQLIKAAAGGVSQCVTVHGKPTAVVLSIEDYQHLRKPVQTKATKDDKPLSYYLLRPGLIDEENAHFFERHHDTQAHREWV